MVRYLFYTIGDLTYQLPLVDAAATYWSPRSAHHVSGNLLPIFRSVRLRLFTAYGIVACCCGGLGFGERQRGTTCTVRRRLLDFPHTVHVVPHCCSPNSCPPQQQATIPYAVKISVLRSWRWAKDWPKHVELILRDQLIVIVASSWFFYITLPTLMIQGLRQIKYG